MNGGRNGRTYLALLFALLVFCVVGPAFAKRVTVRGTTRIDIRAHRAASRTVIEGELKDDGDRALAGERIALEVQSRTTDGGTATSTPVAAEAFHACSPRAVDVIERSPGIFLHTDEQGRFCVALAVPTGTLFARATFAGEPLEDPSSADLEFDVQRRGVALTFAPLPRVVRLDGAEFAVSVIAQSEDEGIMRAEPDLPLRLENEKGDNLGEVRTDAHGSAAFKIPVTRLGAPGPGEIRVRFEGSAEVNRAVAAHPVDRKIPVQLTLSGKQDGEVAEDGITLHVKPMASTFPVPGGAIEARIAETVVGTGVIAGGEAAVVLVFHVDEAREQAITLHYQPTDPYFLDGEPLKVQVTARPPSPLRAAPMVVLFALVIAFMVLGRRPPRAPVPVEETASLDEPVVRVAIGAATQAPVARGLLFDAHSGEVVRGVSVQVLRAQFPGAPGGIVAEGRSDDAGRFELKASVPFAPGDRIVAEGEHHRRVEKPLPGPGEYRIALVARRRALLDGLVLWARGAGGVRTPLEPTPRDVRAQRRDAEAWTRAVERAAYTGKPVDAATEEAVDQHKPSS